MVGLAAALAACGGAPVRAPVANGTDRAPWHPSAYVVHRGDTLYSIAWEHRLDYHALARWNGIGRPYTIYPGQRLRLTPPTHRSHRSPPRSHTVRPETRSAPKARTRSRHTVARIHWQWPTHGPVIKGYHPDGIGKKGVELGGRAGQPVRAAAAGRVVYSGSGLVGYGRLIIIKHGQHYLSAYGNNRRLLVKEGERVRRGQRIAQMGSSGSDRVALHFEIRRDGKPVDPLRYLPKR